MADIVLKTYRGGSVTPQDDAIIHQTVIATNGVFKGCQVSYARGNVLALSQGFGMIKGRFFEVYDTEIPVQLNSTSETLQGRIYIHLDLSNADEPIQILTETAPVLGTLGGDEDINYNNTTYDMELATFSVTNTALLDLVQTVSKITGASAGGGASSLQRNTEYRIGDFATCGNAPGWVTLYCTQSGTTAPAEPVAYGSIAAVGDVVVDGTCIFTARDIIGEMDILSNLITSTQADIDALEEEINKMEEDDTAPIGTVKFMASSEAKEGWLPCDGSYVSASEYPDLVAVLGGNLPSSEAFQVLSDGEISYQISNGAVYAGRLWVFSYSSRKLYGVDLSGGELKTVELTSGTDYFADFVTPSTAKPIALSIVPHFSGTGAKVFLTQIISDGTDSAVPAEHSWKDKFLIFCSEFTGEETTLDMAPPFTSILKESSTMSSKTYYYYPAFDSTQYIPYVVSKMESGVETYYCAAGARYYTYGSSSPGALKWTDTSTEATLFSTSVAFDDSTFENQRTAYTEKNKGELVTVTATNSSSSRYYYIYSVPSGIFEVSPSRNHTGSLSSRNSVTPLNVAGETKVLATFDVNSFPWASISTSAAQTVKPNLTLPETARVFVDGGVYLWSKGMFIVFVGTGIIFSNSLEAGSFGYLDTSTVVGRITQFGFIACSADENELYILGQDSSNHIKVARLLLNTVFDYSSDGAFLPTIAANGLPAYIKAYDPATT